MKKVIICECTQYNLQLLEKKLNAGMALLGGWDKFVAPGMKVLLKVNLIGPKSPETAAIIHPELVRSLTRILKARGCLSCRQAPDEHRSPGPGHRDRYVGPGGR